MTMKTTMALVAVSPELVKGTGVVTVNSEGHTLTSNITFTSEWKSASCDAGTKNKLGELLPGLKSKLSATGAAKNQTPIPNRQSTQQHGASKRGFESDSNRKFFML